MGVKGAALATIISRVINFVLIMIVIKKRIIIPKNQEIIKKRLEKARNEIKIAEEYGYIVVNDTVDNAADRIMAIIRAEHARTDRVLDEYKKLMEE